VLLGLGRSALVQVLPCLLRIGLSLGVWLVVLPLGSAYLYQGWIHSIKSVVPRWRADLLLRDGASGAVVAAIVVVSFLSLMSLADFMRFHWNPEAPANRAGGEEAEAEARAEAAMDEIRAGGLGAMREAVEAIAAENGMDLAIVRDDHGPEEAAMPDPFEMDARDELGRRHHRHHHHHHPRNQRQRQRDLALPVARDDDDAEIHSSDGKDVEGTDKDVAVAQHLYQMERIRGGIEDRRRQNRDVVERENNGSGDISDVQEDDDLYDNVRDYSSDDSTNIPPPLENVDMMDQDEAALENMMRLQEEAMLDLDSDDEDGDVNLQIDAPAAPAAAPQQGQPQNAGGRFEPQFAPLDPGFEQEEEMVSQTRIAVPRILHFGCHSIRPLTLFYYLLTTSIRRWNFNSPSTSS
jgi:hypothetical protein